MIIFGFCGSFVFDLGGFGFLFHIVKEADNKEDNESNDDKINKGLDEVPVVYCGGFDSGNISWDSEFEISEVKAAN